MRTLLAALLLLCACDRAFADTPVGADAIAARIGDTIAQRLPAPGRYRVVLPDPGYQLVLPASAEGRYDIAALTFDPARQTFTAALAYTNASGEREYARIAGHAAAVIAVPALIRDLAAGETITDADLTTIEVPAGRAAATLVNSAADLAGRAARRPLRANTPLFAHDVRKPVVIKKGELVTVVYAVDGIELSAQGQAQSDAGKGDTVQVLNTRSRRTIEARVVAPGMAVVTAPAATLAAR
jgi:flagella basal body P-ring formation protein FlgA